MKNKLKEYPRLPMELNSTKDAMVVLERLRLRPRSEQVSETFERNRTHWVAGGVLRTFSTHKDGACYQPHKVLAGVEESLGLHDPYSIKLAHKIYIGNPIAQMPLPLLTSAIPTTP